MATDWTIIASTGGINTVPADNLAIVVQPPLSYLPDGPPGTKPAFIMFGLAEAGVWAAAGSDPATGGNSGVSQPTGAYSVSQEDKSPWSRGGFLIGGTNVQVPGASLKDVISDQGVISGEVPAAVIEESPTYYAMAAQGNTLFGVVIYPFIGPVEGAQTVGVYKAEASPPEEG